MDIWLRIIKLFELEVSGRRIASQTGLAYNTVHKALMVLCHSILAHAKDGEEIILSGEIEFDESYFGGRRKGKRGRGAAGKIPVFGILSRGEQVSVSMVPDVWRFKSVGNNRLLFEIIQFMLRLTKIVDKLLDLPIFHVLFLPPTGIRKHRRG